MVRAFSILIYFIAGIIALFTGGFLLYELLSGDLTGWVLWITSSLLVILGIVSLVSAVKKKFIIRKRFVILHYVFLVILSALLYEKKREPNEYYIKAKVLNMRKGPGKNYAVIGKLKSGESVFALDTVQGNWILVQADNKQGYVFGKYLKTDRITTEMWVIGVILLVVWLFAWAYISPPPILKVTFPNGLIAYKRPVPREKEDIEHEFRADILEKGRYIQKVEEISIFPTKGWVRIRLIDELNPNSRKTPVYFIRESAYEQLKEENK